MGNRPLDLWHFGNDISVASGKKKLKWYKLRENGKSIRWVSQCCHTTMVVHHPGYENKIFMVMADSVEMGGDISEELDVVFRGQMKDYPKSKLKEHGKFGTLEGPMEAFTSGNFWSLHEVESKIG